MLTVYSPGPTELVARLYTYWQLVLSMRKFDPQGARPWGFETSNLLIRGSADAFESLTVNPAGDLPHSGRCFCRRRNVSNAVQQKVSQTTLAAKAPRTSLRKCAPR